MATPIGDVPSVSAINAVTTPLTGSTRTTVPSLEQATYTADSSGATSTPMGSLPTVTLSVTLPEARSMPWSIPVRWPVT